MVAAIVDEIGAVCDWGSGNGGEQEYLAADSLRGLRVGGGQSTDRRTGWSVELVK